MDNKGFKKMDTMIQIAESLKKKIDEFLPKHISPAIVQHINDAIDHELTTDETTRNVVSCRLWEVDLEENWVKLQVPQSAMDKGFHGGSVIADFSEVQG